MHIPALLAAIPGRVLFDTGASEVYLSKSFVDSNHIPIIPNSDTVMVTSAGGSTIHIHGIATISLSVQSLTCMVRCWVADLHDAYDLILGESWLSEHSAVLSYSSMTVALKHDTKLLTLVCRPIGVAGHSDRPTSAVLLTALQYSETMDLPGHRHFLVSIDAVTNRPPSLVPLPLRPVIEEFDDVFQDSFSLPPERNAVHPIPLLPGSQPSFTGQYRMSPVERKAAIDMVQDLLARGLIEPSTSPWASSLVMVAKPDGSLRACVDYRKVNSKTKRNRAPLPRIDDVYDQLQGAKVFSNLDLTSGYHQIRIKSSDVEKTAFNSPLGLFQFKVLPFGLCNAPSAFQATMNKVLAGYIGVFVQVYLDDILIYSETESEHVEHVRLVLQRLRDSCLFAKLAKCRFMQSEVKFLGAVVSADGIKADPSKLQAVRDWPVPKNVNELRSFLGFACYLRRFVKGYAGIVRPMANLLRKNAPFDWCSSCETSFSRLKIALSTPPVLAIPDFSDGAPPFHVWSDASGFAIGAVLMQAERVIAYTSRSLTPAEKNYGVGEQELLAVVHALTVWRCYLEGGAHPVQIFTDHAPNTFLPTKTNLSRRQARWSEYLQRFDLDWVYKPGRVNRADALSRSPMLAPLGAGRSSLSNLPLLSRPGLSLGRGEGHILDQSQHLRRYGLAVVAGHTGSVPTLDFVSRVRSLWPSDPLFHVQLQLLKRYPSAQFNDGLWYDRDQRLIVPDNSFLRQDIVAEAHASKSCGHGGVNVTTSRLKPFYTWRHGGETLNQTVNKFVLTCSSCQLNKGNDHHSAGLAQPLQIPEGPWLSVSMDWITGLPITKLRSDGSGAYDSILVFVDRFTKAIHLAPCRKTLTALDTAMLLFQNVYRLHGIPLEIVSDRDPRFTSHFWKELQRLLGTKLAMSTAFHPRTDGQTERANRVIEEVLRHYVANCQDDWDDLLAGVELAINTSKKRSTGMTPFMLSHGREAILPFNMHLMPKPLSEFTETELQTAAASKGSLTLPMTAADHSKVPAARKLHGKLSHVCAEAKIALEVARNRQKQDTDKHRRDNSAHYSVGGYALLSTRNINLKLPTGATPKLMPKYLGPFKISAKIGPVAYRLDLANTILSACHNVFHVSKLHPYRVDGTVQPPMPTKSFQLGGQEHWEVERILSHEHRLVANRIKTFFTVRWAGFSAEHDTVEPAANLNNCSGPLAMYKSELEASGRSLDPPEVLLAKQTCRRRQRRS
jgi:hypothetical protein